jgi:hypothetical protein
MINDKLENTQTKTKTTKSDENDQENDKTYLDVHPVLVTI